MIPRERLFGTIHNYINPQKLFKLTGKFATASPQINQLFFDQNQNIWLSGFGNTMVAAGYIDLKKNQIMYIDHDESAKDSFSSGNFYDVFQEKNGTLWFATENGLSIIEGHSVIDPKNKLYDIYDFSKTIFKERKDIGLMDLVEDPKDSTWWMLHSGNRLVNYNPASNQYTQYGIPSSKGVQEGYNTPSFLHLYQERVLVFKPTSFFIFDRTTQKFSEIPLPPLLTDGARCSITHTRLIEDMVWVFVKGANIYSTFSYNLKNKTWKTYPILFSKGTELKEPSMFFAPTCSLLSSTGEFWIAISGGGLAKFSSQKQAFVVVKTKQALDFSKTGITDIVEDKNGMFWLANFNWMKFNPKTYDCQTVLEIDSFGALAIDESQNLCMAALDEVRFFNEAKKENYVLIFDIYDAWLNRLIKLKNKKIVSLYKQAAVVIDFKK
ncbi:MAG: two-component regulator propeller domain-containing protein [Spirosomataceae bacterium]